MQLARIAVTRVALRIALLAILPVTALKAQVWGQYGVTTYQLPQGAGASVAHPINNSGQVAGYFTGDDGNPIAAIFGPGTTDLLGSLGAPLSLAYSINNTGHAVGQAYGPDYAYTHAFLSDGAVLQDLESSTATFSVAYGVNDAGQAVGYSNGFGGWHAFLDDGSGMQDLGTLGGSSSIGYGINDSGQVVGFGNPLGNDGVYHAFLFSGGVMRDLGTLGGSTSYAYGINSAGLTIGGSWLSSDDLFHAFVDDGTTMRDLGTLGGAYASAFGIDDSSRIIGSSATAISNSHAALWENDGSGYVGYDLNQIVDAHGDNAGWVIEQGYGISSDGRYILAQEQDAHGVSALVVLHADDAPVSTAPEPHSFVLLGTALLSVGPIMRRRHRGRTHRGRSQSDMIAVRN